jgi:hypothetical protein
MNGRCIKLLSLTLALLVSLVFVAGAQVKEPAKPPTGPECRDNGQCDRAQYCQKRSGKCEGPGHCVVRPQLCPEIFDPVCGCDGNTYSNFCFAAMAGVNVRHAGACKSTCQTNAQCKAGQFCSKPTGECNGRGACATKPEICPFIFDPVCGCDNKTYGNACEAAAAGVSVSHLGECAAAKK